MRSPETVIMPSVLYYLKNEMICLENMSTAATPAREMTNGCMSCGY